MIIVSVQGAVLLMARERYCLLLVLGCGKKYTCDVFILLVYIAQIETGIAGGKDNFSSRFSAFDHEDEYDWIFSFSRDHPMNCPRQ